MSRIIFRVPRQLSVAVAFLFFTVLASVALSQTDDVETKYGESGFADSGDIKIHFVTAGKGPLLVLIHGFPDFWYTWRNQMPELSKHYQVVAIDQRGYNKSGQPKGVENYAMEKLVGDVAAVIKHFKQDKAIVMGHDWGGAVAWSTAMMRPDMVERLIILNTPHFKGLRRELANNPQQRKNSGYARFFQTDGAAAQLNANGLADWVKDKEARKHYVAAFEKSSFEGMLNYYKANYPREPYMEDTEKAPPVKCSVLMIHGLKDTALLAAGLNNTWDWLEKDLTLVTVPKADHFVQHDASDTVTKTVLNWLQKK